MLNILATSREVAGIFRRRVGGGGYMFRNGRIDMRLATVLHSLDVQEMA